MPAVAVTSYPYENQDTTEVQYSWLLRNIGEGVMGAVPSTNQLRAYGDSTGMTVKVPAGRCVVRGHVVETTALTTLTVEAANTTARIDLVVARIDPAANAGYLDVKKGTPGQGTPPALTRSDTGVYEVALARVAVGGGVVTISAASVTDARRFLDLGWVTHGRPPVPLHGMSGFNFDLGYVEAWTGSAWAATQTRDEQLASATASAGALVRWAPDGGIAVIAPTSPAHATRKDYVDTIAVRDATSTPSPGKLVKWAADGGLAVQTPTSAAHPVRKDMFDGMVKPKPRIVADATQWSTVAPAFDYHQLHYQALGMINIVSGTVHFQSPVVGGPTTSPMVIATFEGEWWLAPAGNKRAPVLATRGGVPQCEAYIQGDALYLAAGATTGWYVIDGMFTVDN